MGCSCAPLTPDLGAAPGADAGDMLRGSSSATASSWLGVALKAGRGAAAKGECSFQGVGLAAGPLLPMELLVPLDAREAA